MQTLVKFFTLLTVLTSRIGLCGNVGLIAGSIAGGLLSLLAFMHPGLVLSDHEGWHIALLLTAFTWLVLLVLLVALVRLTLISVALPSLLNAFLTCLVTVFLAIRLSAYGMAWLIGILVGILVGAILCRLNALLKRQEA